jgi:hypothetical protein
MDSWEDMDTDCETAAELWHPEYGAYYSQGERVDREGFIESCHRTTANRASVEGSWTSTEVRVLSPDAAVFIGAYESTMGYLDGSPTRHWPNAHQIILAERTETGWGITTFSNFNGPAEVIDEG